MPSVAASTASALPVAPATRRLSALGIAAASSAPLAVGAILTPDPSGVGTHEQLGLPACGWIAGLGIPCPSCGMTTSFAFAARGDLADAFAAQPAGALLALLAAMVTVVALWTALTGSRSWEVLWSGVGRRAFWAAVAVAVLAWVYKIAVLRLAEVPVATGALPW